MKHLNLVLITMIMSVACYAQTPSPIIGSSSVCIGQSAAYTDGVAGGTWSSSSTAIAIITGSTGILTGASAGTSTITYTLPSLSYAVKTVTVNGTPVPMAGPLAVCAGLSLSLGSSTTGGAWTSSNTLIATVDGAGVVTGAMIASPVAGTATITYSGPSACAVGVVTVNSLPNAFAVAGGGSYCAGGTGVAVTLIGSSAGVNYQLYLGGTAVAGSVLTGAGGVLSWGLQTTAGIYSVVATNPVTACSRLMALTATVSISPLPAVFAMTGGGSFCLGGATPVGISGSATGVNYELYKDGTALSMYLAGTGGPMSFGYQTASGTYTAVARSILPVACTSNMTGGAVVGVLPSPTDYTVTGGGTYCSGGAGVAVGIANSDGGVNYQLQSGSMLTTFGSPVAGTGGAISFGLQTTTGSYIVIATNTATTCNNSMSTSVTVDIAPLPNAYHVTGGGGYCSGPGVHVGLDASDYGASYMLYRSGTLIGSAIPGSGSPLDFGAQTVTGTYNVVAVDVAAGCVNSMAGSAIIGTGAAPAAHTVTGGGAYCAGGAVYIGLSNSDIGINYQLYLGAAAAGTAIPGTGSPINFGSYNTVGTYTVLATDAGTGCAATMPGSAVISISPLPAVYSLTGGGSFCAGGLGVNIGLSGSQTGIIYQLHAGGGDIGAPVAGTGGPLSFGFQTSSGIYTVTATNTISACVSNMTGSSTVTTHPAPSNFDVTGGGSYCTGGAGVTIGLNGSETGVNYRLYLSGAAIGLPVAGTGAAISFGLHTAVGAYTVVATNAFSSCTGIMFGSVSISIDPLPTSYTVTGGGAYCSGGMGVTVGLSNSSVSTSYELHCGGAVVGVVSGTGSAISFGLATAPGSYTVIATSAAGCNRTMAGSVSVSTLPAPAVYSVTGGGSFCVGGAGFNIGLGGSHTGTNYQLWLSGGMIPGAVVAGTGAAISFGPQTAGGLYTATAINISTGCGTNMAGSSSIVVNSLPYPVGLTGGGAYCSGGTGMDISLSSSEAGVNYLLYHSGIATGAPIAGTGAPASFGLHTTAGTYTIVATNASTACSSTMPGSVGITVNPTPAAYPLTGGGAYCETGTPGNIGLANSETGVYYQLYLGSAPIGSPLAGTGSALNFGPQGAPGVYTITGQIYSSGCTQTMMGSTTVSVLTAPTSYVVTGAGGHYCAGTGGLDVGLAHSDAGINYRIYSGSTAIGVALAGTGAALDFGMETTEANYSVIATNAATACTNNMTGSVAIIVDTLPIVTAAVSPLGCNAAYNLTGSGATFYTWVPGAGLTCSVCPYTQCSPPATTTYTVTGTDLRGCSNTATVSVDGNRIFGAIFPTMPGTTVKVWLIKFNPSDSSISALDSMLACDSSGNMWYHFTDLPTGNYLIKAYLTGGTPGASGYIPTYGQSTPHWDSAMVIAHSGASIYRTIDMIYATVPPGPGFISGYVASGAGRGTATPSPVEGMLMYLRDASGIILTYAYTDNAGNYSFTGLADGSYTVYPESYQYTTTPSGMIVLNSESESVTGINFKQLNNSRTISPFNYTGVKPVSTNNTLNIYPNPAANDLTISWTKQRAGVANVVVQDVMGREVCRSELAINAQQGSSQIQLPGLKNGIYQLTIRNSSINYSSKLVIEK